NAPEIFHVLQLQRTALVITETSVLSLLRGYLDKLSTCQGPNFMEGGAKKWVGWIWTIACDPPLTRSFSSRQTWGMSACCRRAVLGMILPSPQNCAWPSARSRN